MHRIILLATICTTMGCNNPKSKVEHQPTPEVFNDSSPSLKITTRYSGYSDLIQELYAELVLNDKEIGDFEDQRLDYKEKLRKANQSFDHYHANSEEYYALSKQYALMIHDSVYSKWLFSRIEDSENKYKTSISGLQNAIRSLNNEDSLFHDRFIGLQVDVTLKMMEIFQSNEMPNLQKFESFSEIQKSLNQQLEAIKMNGD
ncbi:MAG: hypothetical protein NWS74_12330 [Salibacteraceae bacterium]|nr:hypothetical protein [Salibacteraceae bacterium]